MPLLFFDGGGDTGTAGRQCHITASFFPDAVCRTFRRRVYCFPPSRSPELRNLARSECIPRRISGRPCRRSAGNVWDRVGADVCPKCGRKNSNRRFQHACLLLRHTLALALIGTGARFGGRRLCCSSSPQFVNLYGRLKRRLCMATKHLTRAVKHCLTTSNDPWSPPTLHVRGYVVLCAPLNGCIVSQCTVHTCATA